MGNGVLYVFLNIFIVKQQKKRGLGVPKSPFFCLCCLNVLNIKYFNMFKGATSPCHTCVFGLKNECLYR